MYSFMSQPYLKFLSLAEMEMIGATGVLQKFQMLKKGFEHNRSLNVHFKIDTYEHTHTHTLHFNTDNKRDHEHHNIVIVLYFFFLFLVDCELKRTRNTSKLD